MRALIERLARDRWLTTREYEQLLQSRSEELTAQLIHLADRERRKYYGTRVFLRGLVGLSSVCRQDCRLCGLRSSDGGCFRWRLRPREILDCCEEGWGLDLRSFVLQGGQDDFYSDRILCGIIEQLRRRFPDCSVTLAMGERSRHSYERLYNAGADGYVLMQETADRERYGALHPQTMSQDRRLHCLNELMDIGYQTGCGFLVGLPGQTPADLARELKFLEEFQPHSVALAPAVPGVRMDHLIPILRLMLPQALLTAPDDPAAGVLAGANVVMAGLSPMEGPTPLCGGCRAQGRATEQSVAALSRALAEVGFELAPDRGDWNG